MIDLKNKQREIKSKFKIIQQASDRKKDVDDLLKKYDDTLENLQGQVGSTLESYADIAKKKIPNVENIFEKITKDLQKILPVKQKDGESMLRRITRESVKETTESIKPIFLDNVRKLFFASDSDMNCGTTTLMPVSGLTISPKEFDYLEMLQTDPQTGLGKIIYEGVQPNGDKIKMNKIFYEKFSGGSYIFQSIDETQLFSIEWDSAIQKYKIEGLQGAGTTIDQFITKYYETIEFPKISDVLKNSFSMLIPAGGINVTNGSYDVNLNKLTRVINKICAVCGSPQNTSLKQNAVDQFNENDVDFGSFFA
jgi:archaellum component FlaC